jgi:hypothetical protein
MRLKWRFRVRQIRERVEKSKNLMWRRKDIEKLFDVHRSQGLLILRACGSRNVLGAQVISRSTLLQFLSVMAATPISEMDAAFRAMLAATRDHSVSGATMAPELEDFLLKNTKGATSGRGRWTVKLSQKEQAELNIAAAELGKTGEQLLKEVIHTGLKKGKKGRPRKGTSGNPPLARQLDLNFTSNGLDVSGEVSNEPFHRKEAKGHVVPEHHLPLGAVVNR